VGKVTIVKFFSVAYALVMMAVLIGMLVQVAEDGWLAPSTLSLLFVTFVFVLAGFLHPQELV
jgi:chitin synthase